MASRRYEVSKPGMIWMPARFADQTILVERVRGRTETRIRLSAMDMRGAWSGPECEITLGDLLRSLGLTADDCTHALADSQPAQATDGRD